MDSNRDAFSLPQAQYETLLNAINAQMKMDWEKDFVMYLPCYVVYDLRHGSMCESVPNQMNPSLDCCRTKGHELLKMMKTISHDLASTGFAMTSSSTTISFYVSADDHTMKMWVGLARNL